VQIAKGTFTSTRKYLRTQTYTVKNSGKHAKTVLIEYPLEANWKLVEPKEPTEKTRDMYRFAVTVEPGKPATLKIVEDQTVSQQIALSNLPDDMIVFYQHSTAVSEGVKKALTEVVKRKQELQLLITQRQEQEQTISMISQEQGRIRENMSRLDRNNDLYARYVKKFSEQEDQVEKAHAQIDQLNKQINERQKALDDYLLSLDLS
jgi:myosin heavy subunit